MRVTNLGNTTTPAVLANTYTFPADYNQMTSTVQVNVSGDPTAITVDIEGSIDGINWFQLDTHAFSGGELAALIAFYHIVDKPVKHMRANVTALTATTSATVEVLLLAGR